MRNKLSIIIPVYNVGILLKRCLNSIVDQKCVGIEIILVDDGSTDHSLKICEDYSKKYKFISTFHKNNGGSSSARNFGLKYASGEYIWFIDSDDRIEKGSLEQLMSVINRYKSDVFICSSKKVTESGEIVDECKYSISSGQYSSSDFMLVLEKNPNSVIFAPQYYIAKRDFLLRNKIYFHEGIIHEDELWIPQLLIKADNIYYSNLNIYYHYMRNESVMHSTSLIKSGVSCLFVANELFKIYDNSGRCDLRFLRDKAVNIFLQAVWKIPNFINDNKNNKRNILMKNSFFIKTKMKSLLFFISPKLYLFFHSKKELPSKKAGIITIIDRGNFGNRLQNYALSYYCNEKLKINTLTLENYDYMNNRKFFLARVCKHFIYNFNIDKNEQCNIDRKNNFQIFDNNIKYFKSRVCAFSNLNKFQYLIVGSDQVWNPNFRRLRDLDVLRYVKKSKKISYAASFGVEEIERKYEKRIRRDISKFDSLSVRERSGQKIIKDMSGKNAEVLVDPTMLLSGDEWRRIAKKPIMKPNKKYILCYFLGDNSEERKDEINRVASNKSYEVINLLDKNDKYYGSGPSEFIWLIDNAMLVCTDSFHSSVFSIILNTPFIVYDREQKKMKNMGSRISTLLQKFRLESRRYNGSYITPDQLLCDYSETYRILDKEKEKSKKFLKKALNINEE